MLFPTCFKYVRRLLHPPSLREQQESIILASKGDTSKSVARSVAIGLLLGKSVSFGFNYTI